MASSDNLGSNSSQNIRVTIVEELPPLSEQDPNTIYIPLGDKDSRDLELGRLMDRWAALEGSLAAIVHILMGTPENISYTVVSSLSGIKQIRDLAIALAELRCLPDEQKDLTKFCEKAKDLATKRNHIIHGRWSPEIYMSTQANPFEGAEVVWARIYDPISPTQRQAINIATNQKERAKYRFTPDQIKKITERVAALNAAVVEFSDRLRTRLA